MTAKPEVGDPLNREDSCVHNINLICYTRFESEEAGDESMRYGLSQSNLVMPFKDLAHQINQGMNRSEHWKLLEQIYNRCLLHHDVQIREVVTNTRRSQAGKDRE